MYLGYFGLTERPFSIAPDPQYLYMSKRHKEAMAHLSYGLSQGGCFIVLTGEVGTGKTTLCRNLLGDLPENVDVALILNANINEQELLQTVCDELKIGYQSNDSQKQLLDHINRSLLAAFAENRQTVLIIDEAQLLSRDVLEQIRLLTNLETTKSKLLQIILIGQPELSDLLSRNDLRQLAQRVTARYHLGALKREEIEEYINFRLAVAGCKQPIFSRQALTQMHRLTEGIPRKINVLADHALLSAYANAQRLVDSKTIKTASRDVFITTRSEGQSSPSKWPTWWWAVPLLVLLNLSLWYLSNDSIEVANNSAAISDDVSVLEENQLTPSIEPQIDQAASAHDLPTVNVSAKKEASSETIDSNSDATESVSLAASNLENLPTNTTVTEDVDSATVVVNVRDDIVPGSVLVSDQFLDASSDLETLPDTNITEPLIPPVAEQQQVRILEGEQVLPESRQDVELLEINQDTAFGKVLETSADLTGRIETLKSLAQQWQASLPRKLLQPACTALKEQGLSCLGFNEWARFERFNRPGILVLKHRDKLHRVIVQSLSSDMARVLIGDQYYEVPLIELLARWTSDGVLLWRPSDAGNTYLEQGSKGAVVLRVRSLLNKALAVADLPLLESTSNTEFDLDMAQKVFALQSRFGIREDSRIGNEVYFLLNEILSPDDTLVLSANRGTSGSNIKDRFDTGSVRDIIESRSGDQNLTEGL